MEHILEYEGHKIKYTDELKDQANALGLDLEAELISAMKYEHMMQKSVTRKIESTSAQSYVILTDIDIQHFKDNFGIDLTILLKQLLDDNEEQSKEFGCFSYEMSCHDGTFEIMLCR